MKQNLFLKLLVLVTCLSSALSATAYDFYYSGFYYNVTNATNKTVEVTSISDDSNVYMGDIIIPSTVPYNGSTYTVTRIGNGAFRSTGLSITSISIPSTVKEIGNVAFYDQHRLSEITLPSNLEEIGNYAFFYCSNLTSINIPNSVTWLGTGAFSLCERLASVTIGSGLTDIKYETFKNCYALTNLTIGSNVTSIGYQAFYNDSSLTEVVIPNKVTTIDNYAFQACKGITKMTVGSSVTSIGDKAFDFGGSVPFYSTTALPARDIYCKSTVPPTITSTTFGDIGSTNEYNPYLRYTVYVHGPYSQSLYAAAPYWSNFSTIPSTSHIRPEQRYDFYTGGIYYNISGSSTAKVTNKNGGTLSNDNITSYTGHVTIPNTAYDNYTSKTYNVTAIGTHAFDETRLMNLNSTGEAPSLRGTQGDLKSVTVGNNVTTIEEYAFTNATGLACVSLGSGVTSIGNYAFNGCSALTSVFSRRATPPTITSSTFDNSHYSTATVYVPTAAAVTNYKAANYWRNFTNIKVIPTLNEALNVSGGTINFTSTGSYPWMVMADGGGLYAQSGNYGIHSSSSTLTATVTVPTGGASLTFDFKAWGEGSTTIYDKCIFSVDGTQQYSYGARDNDWETYTVQLTAGTHTLTWTYSKDGSINPIGDFFAVRNVKLNVEAYACWDITYQTLTFYYDGLRSSRTGTDQYGFIKVTYDLNTGTNAPVWNGISNIALVIFDESFANARPTSTYKWFSGMPIQNILGLSNLNTENVTNMSFMFSGCSALSSLDVSNFNTAKVTSMWGMFAQCVALTSLDLSNFNTANVTDMSYMFSQCANLTSLDVSNFNTAKVTSMTYMFYNCSNLTNIDVSNFNTAKVTDMYFMFYNCPKLTTIYAGSGWTTNAVTSSGGMFSNCTKLVGGKGTTYNSSHTDKAYAHIDGGPSNPGYFTDINASQAGDVNGDGQVTIADVTALIDSLLSGVEVPLDAADVNGDGQVTIADVTALIDMLLSGN